MLNQCRDSQREECSRSREETYNQDWEQRAPEPKSSLKVEWPHKEERCLRQSPLNGDCVQRDLDQRGSARQSPLNSDWVQECEWSRKRR